MSGALFFGVLLCECLFRASVERTGINGWACNVKDYFVLFLLLTPQAIQDNYEILNMCINAVRILLLMYYILLQCFIKRKVDAVFGLILLKDAWMVMSDFINQCGYSGAMKQIAIELLIYFFVKNMSTDTMKEKRVLVALTWYLHFCLVINLITNLNGGIYISPDNGFAAYFLGDKNTQTPTILVALFISLICAINMNLRKFKVLFLINYIIAFISAITVHCGTLEVTLILGILIYIFLARCSINRIIFIVGSLLLEFLVVVIGIQKYFATILYMILRKQATFTGRTLLWEQAIKIIKKSPWIGFGYDSTIRLLGITRFNEFRVYSAHNAILQKCLGIGFIGVLFFLAIFYLPFFRSNLKGKTNNAVIMLGLSLFFLTGLTETYLWCTIYIFTYILIFYLNIDDCNDK